MSAAILAMIASFGVSIIGALTSVFLHFRQDKADDQKATKGEMAEIARERAADAITLRAALVDCERRLKDEAANSERRLKEAHDRHEIAIEMMRQRLADMQLQLDSQRAANQRLELENLMLKRETPGGGNGR